MNSSLPLVLRVSRLHAEMRKGRFSKGGLASPSPQRPVPALKIDFITFSKVLPRS